MKHLNKISTAALGVVTGLTLGLSGACAAATAHTTAAATTAARHHRPVCAAPHDPGTQVTLRHAESMNAFAAAYGSDPASVLSETIQCTPGLGTSGPDYGLAFVRYINRGKWDQKIAKGTQLWVIIP